MTEAPLRVIHLTTASSPIAGAEALLVDLARVADRHAWELSFITVAPSGDLQKAVSAAGWRVADLGAHSVADTPGALSRLRSLLRRWRGDVLHTHLHHASVLGALAASRQGLPLIQTRHYSDYMLRFGNPLERAMDGWAARRCDLVAAVSEATRDHLIRVEGLPEAKIRLVHNGVDAARLGGQDPAWGRKLLAEMGAEGGPVIGCTATYNPRKGHEHLLQAFALLRKDQPRAHLVLLGRGTDSPALMEHVAALGLQRWVHLAGYHPDAHAVMAALDVYVQPSVEEGFGLAVLEAMAMGRPVVVSDVGGMARTVEHGVSGLRVPVAYPAALADVIAGLLDDPARAAALGRAGAVRVRDHYSLATMAAAYDALYHEVKR